MCFLASGAPRAQAELAVPAALFPELIGEVVVGGVRVEKALFGA